VTSREQAVIDAARSCKGTRFRHQGRQRGIGMDCAGLIIHAFVAGGYRMTDRKRYAREPNPSIMRTALAEVFVPICDGWTSEPRVLDVAYMRFGGEPQHLALWTGSSIIHAYLRMRGVVEHGLDGTWRSRIVTTYRHKDRCDV